MLIAQILSLLVDLFTLNRRSEHHKNLQILPLRQQLRILQRQHSTPPRISRWERFALAVLSHKLARSNQGAKARLGQVMLLFKPDAVLHWHREPVRRKWTFKRQLFLPRRETNPELVDLLVRLARENPSWGYSRLQGELIKLGYHMGRSTVRDILKRQHIPPAPEQKCPVPIQRCRREGPVTCRNVLGGIIHNYHREAT